MFRSAFVAAVLIALPTISSAQQPCTTDARRVVNELYRHMLERSADAASQGWVDKLTSGSTVREVVHAIVDSPEHNERFYNANEGAVANDRGNAELGRQLLDACESGEHDLGDVLFGERLAAQVGRVIILLERRS